jgi:hypothetical protein
MIIVDGERLSKSEVRKLVNFFDHECKEVAGEFFDQCRKGLLGDAGRSEKFRAFWSEVGFRCGKDPQLCYVETHYQNFAEDVRGHLASLLARRDVAEHDKQQIHRALIIQQMMGMNSQHVPVQLQKDSQQYAGDGYEVKQTALNFGNQVEQSQLQRLLGTTATRH